MAEKPIFGLTPNQFKEYSQMVRWWRKPDEKPAPPEVFLRRTVCLLRDIAEFNQQVEALILIPSSSGELTFSVEISGLLSDESSMFQFRYKSEHSDDVPTDATNQEIEAAIRQLSPWKDAVMSISGGPQALDQNGKDEILHPQRWFVTMTDVYDPALIWTGSQIQKTNAFVNVTKTMWKASTSIIPVRGFTWNEDAMIYGAGSICLADTIQGVGNLITQVEPRIFAYPAPTPIGEL
jgi:hypothetical protein